MIMLGVADVTASVAFYRDTLGLKLQNESPEFAFFSAGGVTLGLSKPLGTSRTPRTGATELIFPVQSVAAAFAELAHRGCKFVREPRVLTGESYGATFSDPDGHYLTLFGGK